VAVDRQIAEEHASLASGQAALQTLAATLDDERTAQLDTGDARGRQGHSNIVAIPVSYNRSGRFEMTRLIRCECGFVARGDSDDEVVDRIREHMRTDHPALLQQVGREDLLGWIQFE
jgi:predicted small metal-binding protein